MARRRSKTLSSLDIPPHNPSGWQIMVKGMIGLIVGTVIAFLVFIVLVLVSGIINQALTSSQTGSNDINPLLPLILMVIAFLGTFIGNMILVGTFNLIYTDKYYNLGKMFAITLLINVLVFLFFIPLYILFTGTLEPLLLILCLHILITVFMCYTGAELTTHPNYSASSLVGSARGFTVSIFIFAVAFKLISINSNQQITILIALPPILAYLFIPFFQTLWEKIYYKFYSMGNNFLYIPSLNEVMVDAEDNSEMHIDRL